MHHSQPTCACTALRKASRAVTRLYDDMLDGTEMSIVQFSLLRHLSRQDSLPLMQLAERLVMDRTTLYRALKPLEQRGWVLVADADKRAKLAALTPEGQAALRAAAAHWEHAQARLLLRLGAEKWAAIEASLAELVEIATEAAA